jgi:rRNA pseudouridine-1189 N-methylase Emg1 (Nep1/Mra1 family)
MAKNWSGLEDMAEFKNAEIEEALEEIDNQLLLSDRGEETAVEEMMDEEDDDHGEAPGSKAGRRSSPLIIRMS